MQHRTNIFINTIKLYFVNTVKSHFVNIQILLFAYNIHRSIALHIICLCVYNIQLNAILHMIYSKHNFTYSIQSERYFV